jgi:hypothetical protein
LESKAVKSNILPSPRLAADRRFHPIFVILFLQIIRTELPYTGPCETKAVPAAPHPAPAAAAQGASKRFEQRKAAMANVRQDKSLQDHVANHINPKTDRPPVDPFFFAYCYDVHSALQFNGKNFERGLHIPSREESAAIRAAGRNFLDHLHSISGCQIRGFLGERRGELLFADLWATLSTIQKRHISEGRECDLPAVEKLGKNHPFQQFRIEFERMAPSSMPHNVHLLERVFGRLIDEETPVAAAADQEAAVHRAYSAFENMLTGTEQVLICPSDRWYVRLNAVPEAGRSPEARIAEISRDGRIFNVHRKHARGVLEESDAAACPFFTGGDPNSFIDEWNQNIRGKNHELLQLERILGTGHSSPTAAFIDRSRTVMYHYSGFSLIIQNCGKGAARKAQFITVCPKKKPFTSWRDC